MDNYIIYTDLDGDVIDSFNITGQTRSNIREIHVIDYSLVEGLKIENDKAMKIFTWLRENAGSMLLTDNAVQCMDEWITDNT